MESFELWLSKQIEDEKQSIIRNQNDPMRYTEWGNNLAMERVAEHQQNLVIYEEVMREYLDRC